MNDMRFFLLRPQVILRARVNQPDAPTYPVQSIPFDGVTEGVTSNVRSGMTVMVGAGIGLDTYGVQRVKTISGESSGTINVGRSSRGTRAGELDLVDDAHITIFDDYRVWAKVGYLTNDGIIYKNGDLAVGTNTTQPPPVANAGVPAVGTIDPTFETLKVKLPHVTNTSFATASGASITTYLWSLPTGALLEPGYTLGDSQIEAQFPPGFHWVYLTVTDSNAKTHIAKTFVLAIDPDNDPSIKRFQVAAHTIAPEGQSVGVRIFDDIPQWNGEVGYPDGTLAVLWEGEPANSEDRSNLIFWGWHEADSGDIRGAKTGTTRDVVIQCVDVAGRLRSLPGFSVAVLDDALRDTELEPAITWAYMDDPTMDKFLHYLLVWHSTALEVADWTWTGTGSAYAFAAMEAGADNLYEQVDSKARAMTPDYRFVCDRLGRMAVRKDQSVEWPDNRTSASQGTVTVAHWSELSYSQRRKPLVYQLRESGIVAQWVGNLESLTPLFCLAPGKSPGQGESMEEIGNKLATSQDALNRTAGQRYARLNAPDGPFTVRMPGAATYDPALMTWLSVEVTTAIQAQLRLRFLTARGLIRRMSIEYAYAKSGLVRSTTLEWEREVFGMAAVTSDENWS